jgi:hypothetical protein
MNARSAAADPEDATRLDREAKYRCKRVSGSMVERHL